MFLEGKDNIILNRCYSQTNIRLMLLRTERKTNRPTKALRIIFATSQNARGK